MNDSESCTWPKAEETCIRPPSWISLATNRGAATRNGKMIATCE